ncbi:hypothetical protein F4819DRAFT_474414 [Hypoxylon fuscum]|nr:hypothetical protein F4819DRAFT_474414 [Hypoxylon fuscum]
MGSTISNATNWWAIAHTFAILGQLSLCVVGTASFALSRPSRFDDDIPSHDEFWDDQYTYSALPWASGAVGGLTTMLNIILFAVLWKASGGNKPSQSARRDNAFRNAVIVASIIMLLVVVADVAFAVKTGMDGQDVICAVASIGSILSMLAIGADHFKLQMFSREQKHSYVIELARVSEEGMSRPPEAPPSYEAAVGTRK